jgi:hypothetical protein
MRRLFLPVLLGSGLLILSSLAYASAGSISLRADVTSLLPQMFSGASEQPELHSAATAKDATARRKDTSSVMSVQVERSTVQPPVPQPKKSRPQSAVEKPVADLQYPASYAGKFGLYGTLKDKVTELFHPAATTPSIDLSHLSAGSYMCKLGAEFSKLLLTN